MPTDSDTLTARVQARHISTGLSLSDVAVEVIAVAGDRGTEVVAEGRTGPDGVAVMDLDPGLWNRPLKVRVAGLNDGVALTPRTLSGDETVVLDVQAADRVDPESLARLADHLVATRLVRADDVARDLAAPRADSVVQLLSPADRARLLADLSAALADEQADDPAGDAHLVDPARLRDGELTLLPVRDLAREVGRREPELDVDRFTQPGLGWELFPWARPDDQSYRDYLRSVFVLFAHQQKLGVGANPADFPDIVERQLAIRFFQDFRTSDRTEVPLNRMLVPLVNAILTAATGSGFGFGLDAATLPDAGRAHRPAAPGRAAGAGTGHCRGVLEPVPAPPR